MNQSFYAQYGKRWFDAACAVTGFVLLAPILVTLGLLVMVTSGGPIFFRQERIGLRGKKFVMWKYRTMSVRNGLDIDLLTAKGDKRITRLGSWLRRTKCDELPQLFNVLLGDMSLVGPRPEVPRFVRTFTPIQRRVLEVRPGITGPTANEFIEEERLLAQHPDKEEFYISTLLPAKLESDLRYVEHVAFNTDLKLIANTISRLLLKSPGISSTPALRDTKCSS